MLLSVSLFPCLFGSSLTVTDMGAASSEFEIAARLASSWETLLLATGKVDTDTNKNGALSPM